MVARADGTLNNMRIKRQSQSVCSLSVFIAPVVMLVLPLTSTAEEYGRPWGKVGKPSYSSPDTGNRSGYLGRYNPWGQGSSSRPDEPRYRDRDGDRSSGRDESAPRYRRKAEPQPRQPATPAYPGYGSSWGYESNPRVPSYQLPYSGGYPSGSGSYDSYYGNFWGSPYDTLEPDTGLIWSDMWR